MSVKKILLKKSINSTVFDLYPKTSADIVEYTRAAVGTQGQDGYVAPVETNVAAELAYLNNKGSSDLTEAKNYTDTQVQALEDAIKGLGDGESLVAAFDTLKEIGAWLEGADSTNAATVLSDISDLQTKVGHAAVAESGTSGQEGYVAPQAATGLFLAIDGLDARIDDLEANGGKNVVASSNNGYIQVGVGNTLSDVLVYDDTELRTNLGVASDGSNPATGLHLDVENLAAAVGADNQAATVKGRITALETEVGAASNPDAASLRGRMAAVEDAIGDNSTAASVKGRITALENDLGHASAAAQGDSGDPDYIPAVSATGLHLAVENLQAQVDGLTTVEYVTTLPGTVDPNIVYLLELA